MGKITKSSRYFFFDILGQTTLYKTYSPRYTIHTVLRRRMSPSGPQEMLKGTQRALGAQPLVRESMRPCVRESVSQQPFPNDDVDF